MLGQAAQVSSSSVKLSALFLMKLISLRFSHQPYKWIRYAIGVVIGAKGVLCLSSDSFNALDDNTVLLSGSTNLYYHINDDEKQRMFPLDPDIGCTQITSSTHTPRRDNFREEVAERDESVAL
jgi:hypothetical protein